MSSFDDIEIKLKEALAECARLREENERLKMLLGVQEETPPAQLAPAVITNDSPPDAKIVLFRSLFRGREDVYLSAGKERTASLVILQLVQMNGIECCAGNRP